MSPSSTDSSSAAGRLLLVMRHARAETFVDDDHSRRLTERGTADAHEAGHWLASRGYRPTRALVSSATRTRQTWDALAQGAGSSVEADVEDAAYAAGPDGVLDLLREVPSETEVLLFVGHNPTAASLAHLLDDGQGDPEAFRALSAGFPTAAVAVLAVPVPWAALQQGAARLVAFHVGGHP